MHDRPIFPRKLRPRLHRRWFRFLVLAGFLGLSLGLSFCEDDTDPQPDSGSPPSQNDSSGTGGGDGEQDSLTSLPPGWNDQAFDLQLPSHFPQPPIPNGDELTNVRVKLGRKLFFDPNLSRDSTVSCATCHEPDKAFTDGLARARGIDGQLHDRNAMALANVAYFPRFNWDGQVESLENQAIVPITAGNEMNISFSELVERLKQDDFYALAFEEAYDEGPSTSTITRALAAYERTLISGRSPYDRFLQGEKNAISESAKRGEQLFFSETAECFHCHAGLFFTDNSFQNNGLAEEYDDKGVFRATGDPTDKGRFKVPSLRNVELTAPYMHDGSMETLEEVIRHYESGGAKHPNKSPFIRQFEISDQQRQDLIAFLKSLTDEEFAQAPNQIN